MKAEELYKVIKDNYHMPLLLTEAGIWDKREALDNAIICMPFRMFDTIANLSSGQKSALEDAVGRTLILREGSNDE